MRQIAGYLPLGEACRLHFDHGPLQSHLVRKQGPVGRAVIDYQTQYPGPRDQSSLGVSMKFHARLFNMLVTFEIPVSSLRV